MIKKLCDRCGRERGYNHQNEIDSLEFCHYKNRKEKKSCPNDSRGKPDSQWRFRICPINCALCRECIFEILESPDNFSGGWLHEGDYPPEAYELVQSPKEARVYRYRDHGEWQEATGHMWPTMALLRWQAIKLLKKAPE